MVRTSKYIFRDISLIDRQKYSTQKNKVIKLVWEFLLVKVSTAQISLLFRLIIVCIRGVTINFISSKETCTWVCMGAMKWEAMLALTLWGKLRTFDSVRWDETFLDI